MNLLLCLCLCVCLVGCGTIGGVTNDVCDNAKQICATATAICSVLGDTSYNDTQKQAVKDSFVVALRNQVYVLQNSIQQTTTHSQQTERVSK